MPVASSSTPISPQGSVLSLLTVLENGAAIQTAYIGREGAFGLFAAMYSRVSFNRCIVQFEGHTVRCPIELLQYEFKNSEHVRDLFVSYSETLLSQVQQTVACNSTHTTEERMCRWLLMMHDRAEGEALPYTHEFLSQMLGANRKSVTLAAQSIQLAGLIRYRRGTISSARSRWPGGGVVRMLRHCQGAFRGLPPRHRQPRCRATTRKSELTGGVRMNVDADPCRGFPRPHFQSPSRCSAPITSSPGTAPEIALHRGIGPQLHGIHERMLPRLPRRQQLGFPDLRSGLLFQMIGREVDDLLFWSHRCFLNFFRRVSAADGRAGQV